MSDTILHIKEGTTAPISMQLLANGTGIDLTVASYVRVTMLDNLKGTYHYNSTDVPSYVTIDNAPQGNISLHTPDQTVFRTNKSPYKMVVWVYVSDGTRYACPEHDANIIIVEPEF
jgi:hypothetical protein